MPNFKIVPHLWYANHADEAAQFYASIFPDSRVDSITEPSGPPAAVKLVELTLAGQPFVMMSAGPMDEFNRAISFVVGSARPRC